MEEKLLAIVDRYKSGRSTLVGVLQDVTQAFGYLPEEALREISRASEVPVSLFYSLATFYKSFRLEPIGKKHVCVCVGTACHVRGAAQVVDVFERELSIKAGQTTPDGNFTLETVNCLGACALGPLVTVNGEYHSKLDQKAAQKLLKKLGGGQKAEAQEAEALGAESPGADAVGADAQA
jgi:NADH-quinone oxidoreductase subunit E